MDKNWRKIEKVKCDILSDFQTLWAAPIYSFSSWKKKSWDAGVGLVEARHKGWCWKTFLLSSCSTTSRSSNFKVSYWRGMMMMPTKVKNSVLSVAAVVLLPQNLKAFSAVSDKSFQKPLQQPRLPPQMTTTMMMMLSTGVAVHLQEENPTERRNKQVFDASWKWEIIYENCIVNKAETRHTM